MEAGIYAGRKLCLFIRSQAAVSTWERVKSRVGMSEFHVLISRWCPAKRENEINNETYGGSPLDFGLFFLFFCPFRRAISLGLSTGQFPRSDFSFRSFRCVCVYFNQSTLASFSQQNIVQHDVQFIPILNQRLRFALFPTSFSLLSSNNTT